MKSIYFTVVTLISSLRLPAHVMVARVHRNRSVIEGDIRRWAAIYYPRLIDRPFVAFLWLMTWYPEFRNVFYYRVGWIGMFLDIMCRKQPLLGINVTAAGPGLFIQHGYATIVTARAVGANLWVNQTVTIGYKNMECPIIGDNVTVRAGAKVLGGVTIGDNVIIGANAVVVKDVPANVTVVGVPARIVRRNGVRVDEELV